MTAANPSQLTQDNAASSMRHLDGLAHKTPSRTFSCVTPNMLTLQVGKSRFRAFKYLLQSLLLKCCSQDSNQVLFDLRTKPFRHTHHVMAQWTGPWMFPGGDAWQPVKEAKDLLCKAFHHRKLYLTKMLTCLFCHTQVLPQKEKQRKLAGPNEREREHLQRNTMLALPAKLMAKLSTLRCLCWKVTLTRRILYDIRQHQ